MQKWIPRLADMSAAERAKLRGISLPRGRQILAGAVVADLTMATLDVDSLEICPWALREGIVLRHLESIAQEAPFSLQPIHRTADNGATVMPLRSSFSPQTAG